MDPKNDIQYKGFWRWAPGKTTSEGWSELPGVYPAGGDTSTDDLGQVAEALCRRAQIKPREGSEVTTNRIEVWILPSRGGTTVSLEVGTTTKFTKV